MLGERLARRPPALEGLDDGRGHRAFGCELVLGRVRLGVLELHLQLGEKPLLALGAHAMERATKLLDLEPEMGDQRLGAPGGRVGARQIGFNPRRPRFALLARSPLGEDHRVGGGEVGGERIRRLCHIRRESRTARICERNRHPAAVGRQVFWGIRQSIPSSR
jgi:hypothetical protein